MVGKRSASPFSKVLDPPDPKTLDNLLGSELLMLVATALASIQAGLTLLKTAAVRHGALHNLGKFPQIFAVFMRVVLGIMKILCIPFKILLFG